MYNSLQEMNLLIVHFLFLTIQKYTIYFYTTTADCEENELERSDATGPNSGITGGESDTCFDSTEEDADDSSFFFGDEPNPNPNHERTLAASETRN